MAHYALTEFQELMILATDADSGFGAGFVENLYQCRRYTIYATCLISQAVRKFQARDSARLRAIHANITGQEDVNRLRVQVEAECPQGVYCVFNNAA
ncbi:hypothetical protein BGZ96_007654 [Linnemannia gamsii]|uniref:Uncharacterized protein n=1 Tax=Linnemannia gamsii TaxID=64522 RepID=A0ABQ7KDJ2_9FUNG|nr:hypothetical protein BGZ96_007654 [Linnemannia gamsii]